MSLDADDRMSKKLITHDVINSKEDIKKFIYFKTQLHSMVCICTKFDLHIHAIQSAAIPATIIINFQFYK